MHHFSERFYDHPSGTKVPSVTTVLGKIADERLYNWKLRKGLKLVKDGGVDTTKRDMVARTVKHIEVEDTNDADMGTWLHLIAEKRFRGWGADKSRDHANNSFSGDFLEANEETLDRLARNLETYLASIAGYKTIATEVPVFGEVEGITGIPTMFAGTIDTIIQLQQQIILIDFKSSYSTYDTHAAQVAAYGYGWNQTCRVLESQKITAPPKITRLAVIRIGKTPGSTPYHPEMIVGKQAVLAWALFRIALNLWYIRSGKWGAILDDE